MNWNLGFSASYYGTIVDPQSWRDVERFEITEGKISRTNDSLYQSADITCTDWNPDKERWIRVYLEARQNDSGERHALFTGLATSPERNLDGTLVEFPLQCYSVLKPAEDILLQRGWFAPVGVPCDLIIKDLLSVCPCPVEFGDAIPALNDEIIAEDRESNLSMTRKIINAIGWRLRLLGDGTVQILNDDSNYVTMFDTLQSDVIQPQISVTNDWFNCPNIFRAISGELTATVRDDSPDSLLSTVTRGREVWAEDSNAKYAEGEGIANYALRRLKEEQSYYLKASYNRRYHPNVYPSDKVLLHYPAQAIDGVFRVQSQSIELGYGAGTSEEVSNE